MSEVEDRYAASIERLNTIAADGELTTLPTARAYRLELKRTLRLLRELMAQERRADIRAIYAQQLRCLKRIHYRVIRLEAGAIGESRWQN